MSLVWSGKLILRTTEIARAELPTIYGRLMRKPRGKTAKKGGVWGRNNEAKKDKKRKKREQKPKNKILRTRGTGGGWGLQHIPSRPDL